MNDTINTRKTYIADGGAGTVEKQPPRLTVCFTSDTHGYFWNTNFADTAARPMGLLGMDFSADGNTLVLDGGDTVQGSPMTLFCRTEDRPLPVARAMRRMGYRAVTLGNHDFNCGPAWLKRHLDELGAPCVCANVEDGLHGLPIQKSVILTLENGTRVGITGAVTDWVNRWEKPENLTGITVSDPLPALKAAWADLKARGADLILCIYHGGIERDLATGRILSETSENIACRICEEIPFDLLLTGHQHIPLVNASWHGVPIVQTPANAASYVRAVLSADGAWTSELIPAKAEQAPDERETALRAELEAWLDRPVGHLSRAILPGGKLDMALTGADVADFFNRVQLWASGADVSCAALPNELRGFAADVTVRDVVASYVYANTLTVLAVTGSVLKDALEQCARYFDRNEDGSVSVAEPFLRPKEAHYNYDYFAGIEYTFDLRNAPGSRVTRLERNGAPVLPDDRLSLVMCNYRATGAGDFDMYVGLPVVQEIQTEVSELIISWFLAHPYTEIPDTHPYTVIR